MVQFRRLLVLILFVICCSLLSEAAADDNKGYKCEGATYSSTGRVNNSSAPISISYTKLNKIYKGKRNENNKFKS